MHPDEEPLPPIVDPAQVAEHLHVHREFVYHLIATGELDATKIGHRWRIRRESVERLLAGDVA